MSAPEQRKWFGPKQVGWGYQPQTWQGWVITTVVAVILAAIIILIVR